MLFWVAVFNFVFSIILNVTVITFLFYDPNPQHSVNVIVVNTHVNIICILLTTVWCSGAHWQNTSVHAHDLGSELQACVPEETTIHSLSTVMFAPSSIHMLGVQLDMEMSGLAK